MEFLAFAIIFHAVYPTFCAAMEKSEIDTTALLLFLGSVLLGAALGMRKELIKMVKDLWSGG